MNTELLEEFENSCEFYRNEFKHCSYGSTAIFKPYYSFEDSTELDRVLENSKKFLENLDFNGSFDYYLTLRSSLHFEWEFDLNNNIAKYIEVEIFGNKITAGYTFWDDSLRDSEKNYEMRINREKIERDIERNIDNLEEDNGFQNVCRWVGSKLNKCKKEIE